MAARCRTRRCGATSTRAVGTSSIKKVSLVNYLSSQTKPEEMLVDDSATATVNELGQSLTAMEVHGHFFGPCSLTIVAYDRDAQRLDRSVAECAKAFAAHDGALYDETYNLLNAWLAVVPGNGAHNLRRLALLNTNVADLSFLFTLHTGQRTSPHLGRARVPGRLRDRASDAVFLESALRRRRATRW